MKLLFDQNISFRVVRKILDAYPEAKQVRELGLENSTDRQIWEFAKKNGYSIVTFDADFYDLTNLFGYPPKIIWLRTGNTTTNNIVNILEEKASLIKEFIGNPHYDEIACLEIE